MKGVTNIYIISLIVIAAVISVDAQKRRDGVDPSITKAFEGRVLEYTTRREALERELPAVPKQATAEQISAHKQALLQKVLSDRKTLMRGAIFTPESEQMIRAIIAAQYPGRDRAALRKELAEAENKEVVVKVNAVYPESAELMEMPPTLLLALPQLPKQVRYRFVGTNLLIVDRESHLIVDYMADALPNRS